MDINLPVPGDSPAQRTLSGALNNNLEDQYQLALLLETGDGMEQNIANALGWYKKAASRGHLEAIYRLGLLHLHPSISDYHQAFYWFELASDRHHADAIYQLSALYEAGKGTAPDHARSLQLCREAAACGSTLAKQKIDSMNDWMATDCSMEVLKYSSQKSVLPSNFEVPRRNTREEPTPRNFFKR